MISDGCMFVMPSGIQRRAPFTPLPMCGISTMTSISSAMRKSFGAYLSHADTGILNATIAPTIAVVTEIRWRTRK